MVCLSSPSLSYDNASTAQTSLDANRHSSFESSCSFRAPVKLLLASIPYTTSYLHLDWIRPFVVCSKISFQPKLLIGQLWTYSFQWISYGRSSLLDDTIQASCLVLPSSKTLFHTLNTCSFCPYLIILDLAVALGRQVQFTWCLG